MKKIALVAFAALAVVSAQAVQIAWEVKNVNYPTGGAISATDTSVVALLYDATTYAEADIVSYIKGENGKKASDLSNVFKTAVADDSGYLYAGKQNDDNYAANTTYSFYAVVFDNASIDSAQHFIVTSASQKTKGSGTTTVSFDVANAQWTATNVPEPTTVALLALGLVAAGLKRKVA